MSNDTRFNDWLTSALSRATILEPSTPQGQCPRVRYCLHSAESMAQLAPHAARKRRQRATLPANPAWYEPREQYVPPKHKFRARPNANRTRTSIIELSKKVRTTT